VPLLAGCARTRSISNAGYDDNRGYYYASHTGHPFYRGELSEFDLLGIESSSAISDEQIGKALDNSGRVSLRKGSSVLLIQSGAMQPEKPMSDAMEQHFVVVPFSGQPGATNAAGYAKGLRLVAAQAGCETIVCCWGTLDSASKGNEAKTISWVPVAGWVLPDESQQMRIRLKIALVDVRSGRWAMCSSQAFEDRAHSNRINREAADQRQVEKLKQLAYASAMEDVVKIFTR
jgi:hypothetical protein